MTGKSSEASVQFGRQCAGRLVSLFGRIKVGQQVALAVSHDLGDPAFFSFIPAHPFEPGCIIFWKCAIVLLLAMRSFAQIFPSVVAGIPIKVVDLPFRPLTGHHEPNQAMRKEPATTDANADAVAPFNYEGASGNFSSKTAIPAWTYILPKFPPQGSGLWLVIKSTTDILRRDVIAKARSMCEFAVSHSDVPHTHVVWSVGSSAANARPARYF